MRFNDILGHDRPLAVLKRALANGTLPHAYLFSGEPGTGKKMTALALAAAANCRDQGPDGGCGVCPSCRKASSGNHPDIRILAPDGDEIKIDQIRQIQADLSLKPFEGAKKVLIVDGAESMNAASSNAFLKTLEEPPGDAMIILVTSMPQSLLPTIRSRCQEIRFQPLPRHTLAGALEEKRGLAENDAWFVAALSQGSIGRALAMDVEQEKSDRSEAEAFWSGLGGQSDGQLAALAEALSKDRERFDRLVRVGIEQLRDVLVWQQSADSRLLVDPASADRCRERAERLPLQRLVADLELLDRSRNLLDRRVSAQLVAEDLLFKLGRA